MHNCQFGALLSRARSGWPATHTTRMAARRLPLPSAFPGVHARHGARPAPLTGLRVGNVGMVVGDPVARQPTEYRRVHLRAAESIPRRSPGFGAACPAGSPGVGWSSRSAGPCPSQAPCSCRRPRPRGTGAMVNAATPSPTRPVGACLTDRPGPGVCGGTMWGNGSAQGWQTLLLARRLG